MQWRKFKFTLLSLLLVLIGAIWVYPLVWMFFSSLKKESEFLTGGLKLLPAEPQWDNFVRAWDKANFSIYFINSVTYTVSAVIIVVILCSLFGYAMARVDFPGRKTILVVYVATMFIPKGYTIIPIYLLIKWLGLLNTRMGVILVESSAAHVIFILLLISFFATIPKELEESAEMDGGGFVRIFVRVMLPLTMPVIATIAIVQFIWTWNSFFAPLIFTINNPNLKTLAVGMYNFINDLQIDYTGLAAGATISIVPIITVFIFFQRYFIEGVSGSVKG